MEVGEKTNKRGSAVNKCIEFTLETRYVYVKVRQLPVTFNLRGEDYIGVLLVEIFKEERYVVQGSEKNHVPLNHVPLFVKYLNQQHPNITFTSEVERDGKLPFLDIDISRSQSKLIHLFTANPRLLVSSPTFNSFIKHSFANNV